MSAAIVVLAVIGGVTVVAALFLAVQWAVESSIFHRYKGLKDQMEEAEFDIKALLREFERDTPEAMWAVTEMANIARSRVWSPARALRDRLEHTLEESKTVEFPVSEPPTPEATRG